MYCHTLMEIDRVFIGFVIYPSLIGITAATWGAWKICSPPGLEGVCYWAISPQDLMFTCFFHLPHFPERNTNRFVFWYHPNFLIINLVQLFKSLPKMSMNTELIPFLPSLPHQPRELPWVDERVERQRAIVHLRGAAKLDNCLAIVWKVPIKKHINQTKKTMQGALAASWESIHIYIYIQIVWLEYGVAS